MVKFKVDGTINGNKAKLIVKGFHQTYNIDYQEVTFAPVAKMNIVWVLLSLAPNLEWPLQQLNAKNVSLYDDLEEEVYMELPPCFEETFGRKQVCKLKKSLHCMKQSLRAWFEKFVKSVNKLGYMQR